MLEVIYILFIVLNSMVFAYGKKCRTLGWLTCLFIVIFVAGKRYDGSAIAYDLQNYMARYSNPENMTNIEFGYKITNLLCKQFGLSFEMFYVLLTGSCLLLIFVTVYKLNGNIHFFTVVYMIYFILCPMDQLRNLCAFTALFTSLPLLEKKSKGYKGKLLMHILIAAAFHITYILYTVFLFLDISKKERKVKPILYIMLLFSVFVAITNTSSVVSNLVGGVLSSFDYLSSRYTKYTLTQASLSVWAPVLILLVSSWAIYRWELCHKKQMERENNILLLDNTNLISNMIVVTSCFIPLLLLNSTTYRLIRDISLIGITWIGIDDCRNILNLKRRLEMLAYGGAISIGWFIFDIVAKGYWIDFTEHFFENVYLNF